MALYQEKCAECHNARYGPLLLDWMKDWFTQRRLVQSLLRTAEEKGALSDTTIENFSSKARETEKVGAHNFQLAALQWKALRADLERAISKNAEESKKDFRAKPGIKESRAFPGGKEHNK